MDEKKDQNNTETKTERALSAFKDNFIVVGRSRVKSWHAWLAIGVTAGIFAGVLLVANQSGEFEASKAAGNVYYVSPSGSDSSSGTSASPWGTFSFAIPKLSPGDTLLLKNGTYNNSNSGFLNISCGSNAQNGIASAPITIKSENERMAWIKGDGLGNRN